MKGDTSFSILSKKDDIHFTHEKRKQKQKPIFKLRYMASLSPVKESNQ